MQMNGTKATNMGTASGKNSESKQREIGSAASFGLQNMKRKLILESRDKT